MLRRANDARTAASVSGSRAFRARYPHRGVALARGFTLIEVVVVILVLSVILGMVGLRVTRDDSDTLRDEARRLALVLQNAQQQAILGSRPILFRLTDDGYAFSTPKKVPEKSSEDNDTEPSENRRKSRFAPIEKDELLGPRQLPRAMTLTFLDSPKRNGKESNRLIFDASGNFPHFVLVLSIGESTWYVQGASNGQVNATATIDRSPS